MLSCNYTNNTVYCFNNELCNSCENINYIGVTQENTIEDALVCGSKTDKWVQLYVTKILDIPVKKPSIEGIISVSSSIKINSLRVVKTPIVNGYTNISGNFIKGTEIGNAECTFLTGKKMIIEGVITQKVVYTALVENQALHSATFLIPFSTFIIVDENTALSQEFKLYSYLEDVFVCKLSERSAFSNNTLFIKISAVC